MYKTSIRALVRWSTGRLNAGDPEPLLRLAAPDVELSFGGENSWSTMFRALTRDRAFHASHRGIDEARAFAERFIDAGLQIVIEDILVNGPPWNTRVALRAHDFIAGPGGADEYNNRYVDFIEIRWGRIHRFEVYEDTERVAAWDAREGAARAG